MRIRILAFASVADAVGAGEKDVELPAGSHLSDLRDRLTADFPNLELHWPRLAVAVDGELVGKDVELTDGAEVALLPPVSGGDNSDLRRLTQDPITADAVVGRVAASSRGAVLVFHGTVRDHHQDRPVSGITYSAYRAMAETALARIISEIQAAEPGLRLEIAHRLGHIPAGEASVVIASASAHREAAYTASRTALERIKREVPIWKREHYVDGGSRWREEEPLGSAGSGTSPTGSRN